MIVVPAEKSKGHWLDYENSQTEYSKSMEVFIKNIKYCHKYV